MHKQAERIKPTLDFLNNPRWHGDNTAEIPYAADRIYIVYRRGKDILKSVELFGTKVSEDNGLSTSDRYGVVAEMEFCFPDLLLTTRLLTYAHALFPRAMSQVPCLHEHLTNAARVKYPAALQRCKLDTPLLAVGSLINICI